MKAREMSSDSCESLAKDPNKSSPMSPVSENRTLGSPAVGSLSSPGSTLDNEFKRQHVNRGADIEAIRPFLGSDSKTQRSAMESQLMSEIKDKSKQDHILKHDHQHPGLTTTDPTTTPVAKSNTNTPAAMLVSELFESFKSKSSTKPGAPSAAAAPDPVKPEVDFKKNLRKVVKTKSAGDHDKEDNDDDDNNSSAKKGQIDFKSNLKKTSDLNITAKPDVDNSSSSHNSNVVVDFKVKLKKPSKMLPSAAEEEASANANTVNAEPLDFKARLRKVSGSKCSPTKESSAINNTSETTSKPDFSVKTIDEKRDSITSTESETMDDNNKRKSTGSISSLRKMWESSPRLPLRSTHPPTDLDKSFCSGADGITSPTECDESVDKQNATVKFEKRVWPPVPSTETEKPMVPVKPTVKPPAPTTKPPPPKEPMVSTLGKKIITYPTTLIMYR